jgi:hypothetical protein
MHSELTGVQILVARTPEHAHWFIYFWDLLIVTTENGIATEISYSVNQLFVFFLVFIIFFLFIFFFFGMEETVLKQQTLLHNVTSWSESGR